MGRGYGITLLLFGIALLKIVASRQVIAYFNTGYLGDMPTDGVDQINFAFAGVDGENSRIYLDAESSARLERNLPVMERLKKERPGLKTLITVGGREASKNFSMIAAEQGKLQSFCNSIQQFVEKYDFDGADIYWEFTNCTDMANYTDLAQYVRFFIGLKKTLTLTVSRMPGMVLCIAGNYPHLLSYRADYFNVLAYDYCGAEWGGPVTGFNTPLGYDPGAPCFLDIEGTVGILRQVGVTSDQIVLGLAFYGQQFRGVGIRVQG